MRHRYQPAAAVITTATNVTAPRTIELRPGIGMSFSSEGQCDERAEHDHIQRGIEQRRMPDETINSEPAEQIAHQIPDQRCAEKVAEQWRQEHAIETDFPDHAVTGSVEESLEELPEVMGVIGAAGTKKSACRRKVVSML